MSFEVEEVETRLIAARFYLIIEDELDTNLEVKLLGASSEE